MSAPNSQAAWNSSATREHDELMSTPQGTVMREPMPVGQISPRIFIRAFCILGFVLNSFASLSTTQQIQVSNSPDWRIWKYENLKALDPWGDSDGDTRDIVAVYVKESTDTIHFRIDFLDIQRDSSLNLYFAIDYRSG
ncbi:MAG: hypothetical protein AABZ61_06855, partial [Bacteroidota bacterium]